MRFGRFVGLVLSLFLPAFYRDVARNWGGIGLLYLLLLFTLTWIPWLVTVHLGAQKFANETFPKFANKVPDVTFKNGKVSSPAPQPLEFKDEQGVLVFVLDTTGKIKSLDQTPAMMLVTETKLHQRDAGGRVQITDLAQLPIGDFELTPEGVQDKVDTICTWLAVSLFPACLICSLIRALFIMLLASLAGLIFNAVFHAGVSYAGLLRFGAVGLTLSVYIDTGLDLAGIHLPFIWFFIALILTIAYVAFGTVVSVPERPNLAAFDEEEPAAPPRRYPDDQGQFKE